MAEYYQKYVTEDDFLRDHKKSEVKIVLVTSLLAALITIFGTLLLSSIAISHTMAFNISLVVSQAVSAIVYARLGLASGII